MGYDISLQVDQSHQDLTELRAAAFEGVAVGIYTAWDQTSTVFSGYFCKPLHACDKRLLGQRPFQTSDECVRKIYPGYYLPLSLSLSLSCSLVISIYIHLYLYLLYLFVCIYHYSSITKEPDHPPTQKPKQRLPNKRSLAPGHPRDTTRNCQSQPAARKEF